MRKSLFLVCCGVLAFASVHTGAQAAGNATGFAVLELFTSEGCSSCPPADEALSDISRTVQREGLPVYALEWHVDYWDSLGWKDPFDSHEATERQYAYARALPSDVYTPQLVVNGSLVPSYAGDTSEIERDIRALTRAPASPSASGCLRVQVLSMESGSSTASGTFLRVRADVTGPRAGENLLLVLAEAGLGASPTAGENAGRRLTHSNVVRTFMVLPAASVETRIGVPPGVDLGRSRLVAILQDTRTMKILGADQAAIPTRMAARLTGNVVDAAGQAVAGATVQACSGTVCVPAVTDVRGTFVFEQLPPGSWSLAFDPKKAAVQVTLRPGQDTSLAQPLVLVR